MAIVFSKRPGRFDGLQLGQQLTGATKSVLHPLVAHGVTHRLMLGLTEVHTIEMAPA